MHQDSTRAAPHRELIADMLATSLKRVFTPEPTDRFDSLLRALDERDRAEV